MTILNKSVTNINDRTELALRALGWILSDDARARRFLDLTGLTPDGLRAALAQPETHQAVFDFLCGHEPDLVAAADFLGCAPAAIALLSERNSS